VNLFPATYRQRNEARIEVRKHLEENGNLREQLSKATEQSLEAIHARQNALEKHHFRDNTSPLRQSLRYKLALQAFHSSCSELA